MELATRGRRYADLCRDLYTLAQDVATDDTTARGPARGWRWEALIADALAHRGYPVDAVPGGVRVFGAVPASGLRHQTDAALHCVDAHVIGEWKSYTGPVPKNELLRFKAATDDLYDTLGRRLPRQPILRLFGVGGDASPQLRWYAARHGITLVECTRWPAPVLADPDLAWPVTSAPSATDQRRLSWLSRPLQQVYPAAAGRLTTTPTTVARRCGRSSAGTTRPLVDAPLGPSRRRTGLLRAVRCGSRRMNHPICSACGAELVPAELPTCLTCSGRRPTTIGERAVMILEQASAPLPYWDIQRLMDRQSDRLTHANSLLVYLSRDLRICWAGKGTYGLYRHGLVPNVRGLGPTAEVHLRGAPNRLDLDQLHFVLQHQGYRYQFASLAPALERHLGCGWRNAITFPDTEAGRVRHEQRLAQLLKISRHSSRFQYYRAAINVRVERAVAERARRLGRCADAPGDPRPR